MKFLTDAMLGRLTRLLRIFGYDATYAEDIETSAPDSTLLEYAIKEDLIILTKDYPFHKRAGERSIYLTGEDVYDYLQQLKDEIGLQYNFDMQIARCSVCNSTLHSVEKELIKDEVKSETYKYYDKFFQCNNSECKKIYWKGSHIDDILKKLDEKIN
jgi:uncharacterized protein with PIN domain